MPVTNNIKGVGLIALGFLCFSITDILAKLLTEDFHPFQVAWMRMLGLFLGVCVLIAMRGIRILHTPKPHLQIVRGIVAAGSATLFIFAINYVPLADAVAVSFVAPFIVTVFGALILKEPVGIRRWLAVVAGFIGMLVVIRPGLGVFHPAIFLVLLAATLFAIRQLVSRWLSGVDPIATTVTYTAIVAFSIISVFQPFIWQTPNSVRAYLLVVSMAGAAAMGEILIIRALDIAHSVVLAPIHYTLIIWGTIFGYWVFEDLPDQWTMLGCSVIVVSGLYTTYREFALSKKKNSIKL